MMVGVVMDLIDTSIVNVALPSVQRDLGAGAMALQWLVAGYALAFASALMLGGRLGDVIGYRRAFLIGTAAFAVASLGAALAPGPLTLVIARVMQGAAAGIMVPQTTSLVQRMYSPAERSKVMGLLGGMAGLAAATGPLLCGLLLRVDLNGDEWRLIFLVNLPVAVGAIVAGRRVLPAGGSERAPRLDVLGAALAAAALGAIVLGVTFGASRHWPVWTVAASGTGLGLLVLFAAAQVRRNRRRRPALLVTSLFRDRAFVSGLLLTVVTEATFAGVMLTLTLTLQDGQHYSAITTGLTTLPLVVGMVIGVAVLGELLTPRIGRYTVTVAATVLAAGVVLVAWALRAASPGTWSWPLVPSLMVAGIGLGLLMGPLFAITLQNVDHEDAGAASGTLKATEQLGAVLGVAVLGAVFFAQDARGGLSHAFAVTAFVEVGLLAVLAVGSLWLPRRFKSEEELDLGI
ncbi:MFS transporter [Baekduia alba]|uniref:MFS transporter n=1 Tax=Baekduia alba TaxID=2997333 RepID=UPI00234139EF|nr:MFS transporter [Baekduia alba]